MNPKVTLGRKVGLLIVAAAALVSAVSSVNAAIPTQSGVRTAEQQHVQQASPNAPVGSGFTYQGRLKSGGGPTTGQYDLTFTLYDALTGGVQVGSTVTVTNQTVTEGLFTVTLDFGQNAFSGQARWLEIAVRPAGGGAYTTLSPRQPLTAVPYAMSLATGSTGAVISGTLPGPALIVTNTNGTGVQGNSNSDFGVKGFSSSYVGLGGYTSNGAAGVFGESQGAGDGVSGSSTSGNGVYGTSNSSFGVKGTSSSYVGLAGYTSNGIAGVYGQGQSAGYGVWGVASNTDGVRGQSTGGNGVYGDSSSGYGGRFSSSSNWGVYGNSSSGVAVRGISDNSTGGAFSSGGGLGVYGQSNSSDGIFGQGGSGRTGVWGYTNSGTGIGVKGECAYFNCWGVYGVGPNTNARGVVASALGSQGIELYANGGQYAGVFDGNVSVNGTLSKSAGSFKIDHPLDPENKYLSHSFVESPDMMNVYNGNVTTDAKGEAVVTLPDWFEALNKEFRYQLTIMGEQFAQARISSKIKGNRFTIMTDKPNVEVSWQVTGIRKDPYAEKHRIPVEETKPAGERGKYLHPKDYDQPESKGLYYEERQRTLKVEPAPHQPKP